MPTINSMRFERERSDRTIRNWTACTAIALTCVLCVQARSACAQNAGLLISLESSDGRTRSGVFDARTDKTHLWLQTRSASIALSSSIAWDDVVRAKVNGVWLNRNELREVLRTAKAAPAVSYFDLVRNGRGPADHDSDNGIGIPQSAPHHRRARAKATHIEFYGSAANWDADAPRDGVRIHLTLRDAQDEPLAISGVLKGELWGTYRPKPSRKEEWKRIATWTRTVDASDFHHGVATLKLGYPGKNPELTTGYGADAILSISYQPRRHGALHFSQSIRLRPYERLRDRLEIESGHRYMTRERTR